MPTAAAAGRALQLIRAGYGAALLLVPGPAIRLATGHAPSPRTCRIARLLGARHLVQSALTTIVPLPVTFAIGGQVDTAHTASMLLLAAASRPGRRPVSRPGRPPGHLSGRRAALTDALTEATFAAAGFSIWVRTRVAAPDDLPEPTAMVGSGTRM
jgi:hypothetical protein